MSRYKKLPVDRLTVDDRYQRPLDERRVNKMATEFSDALFGALEVSERNGKCAVFDGQHRLAAAVLAGRSDVPCMVHANLGPEDEARLFVDLQRERKNLKQVDRFRARIFADEPMAKAIAAIVDNAGFTIRQAGAKAGQEHVIQAVTSLERIYRRGNLPETLALISDLWGGDMKSTDGGLLEGMSVILEGYGHRIDEDVLARLRETPPLVILRRAIGHSGGGTMKGSLVAGEIRKVAGLRGRPMQRHEEPVAA